MIGFDCTKTAVTPRGPGVCLLVSRRPSPGFSVEPEKRHGLVGIDLSRIARAVVLKAADEGGLPSQRQRHLRKRALEIVDPILMRWTRRCAARERRFPQSDDNAAHRRCRNRRSGSVSGVVTGRAQMAVESGRQLDAPAVSTWPPECWPADNERGQTGCADSRPGKRSPPRCFARALGS